MKIMLKNFNTDDCTDLRVLKKHVSIICDLSWHAAREMENSKNIDKPKLEKSVFNKLKKMNHDIIDQFKQ